MTVSNYKILKQVYSKKADFREKFAQEEGFAPLDVELRLNWKCNARCVMCGVNEYYSAKTSNQSYELSFEEIKRLLDELCGMGCLHITISGGEATLRSDLTAIIKYASESCHMSVSLNTNGYLLHERKVRELIEAGVSGFTLSLDSPVEEVHDQIRGLNGSFKRIIGAIDEINRYNERSSSKVWININCVLLKDNIRTLGNFVDIFQHHPFHHLNLSPASINTPWDDWTTNNEGLRPSIDDVSYFKNQVLPLLQGDCWSLQVDDPYANAVDEIQRNLHVIFSDRPSSCYVPMVHTVIQCNGDVIPCCYAPNEFVMGNLQAESFQQIWNNAKYKHFRKQCKKVAFNMCGSCRQYELINTRIREKIDVQGGSTHESVHL